MRKNKRNKKKRSVNRKRRKNILPGLFYTITCLAVLALFLSAGFWSYRYLVKLPYFAINEITVIGGGRVSVNEIIKESQVQTGDSLLSTSLKDVREGIERHPWIKEARVRRFFPSGLEISVRERTPVALIKLGDSYLIDRDGVIFKKVSKEDDFDLPVISGVEMEELLDEKSGASDGVFSALNLLGIIGRNEFPHIHQASEIKIDLSSGLSLYTQNGAVRVDIGKRDFEKRLARLERIAASLKDGLMEIDFIDLNYEKKAVVKYRATPGPSKI